MSQPGRPSAIWHAIQWRRGLRGFVAIGAALLGARALALPPGPAALGAFDCVLVDSGGPYRTRLLNMTTVLAGGALTLLAGLLVPHTLWATLPVTAAVCFAVTLARVASPAIGSSSVLMLVLYFAGLGASSSTAHTLQAARLSVAMLLAGGLGAMLLSLWFWPIDAFRPARLAVAASYESLAEFAAILASPAAALDSTPLHAHDWRRRHRRLLENARAALAGTAVRNPARSVTARSLTVLVEINDLLLERTIRLTELTDVARTPLGRPAQEPLAGTARWLGQASAAAGRALRHTPPDHAASFAREGSERVQWLTRRRRALAAQPEAPASTLLRHVRAEEDGALAELDLVYDAVYAVWTGFEPRRPRPAPTPNPAPASTTPDATEEATRETASQPATPRTLPHPAWLDALRANWTLDSAIFRHALRLAVVGVVDVLAMRAANINHGYWLPMTSVILMQPFSAGTARKSMQRVTGTVLGGVVAAILATLVTQPQTLIVVIALLGMMALATYAVDYAVYSFFLTPAFVLMSLPHPHDWAYALIRVGTTLAGALIAILAMRLLWPERAEAELGRLLRRGAAAEAAYLRALLETWSLRTTSSSRTAPSLRDRNSPRSTPAAQPGTPQPGSVQPGTVPTTPAASRLLAAARRGCGLASADAEEALDRVLQEPHLRRTPHAAALPEEALAFATWLRRMTQSLTTLAFVGRDTPATRARLEAIASRLDLLAADTPPPATPASLSAQPPTPRPALVDVAEEQMQRLERQATVLERAAAALLPPAAPAQPAL